MKRWIAIISASVLALSLAACKAGEEAKPSETNAPVHSGADIPAVSESAVHTSEAADAADARVLIAYFSVPEDVSTDGVDAVAGASVVVKDGKKLGNTEYAAKLIRQTVGGELFRIETVEPYPLEHNSLVDQADMEQAKAARPELAAQVEDFDEYEIILLGYPNWWADLPMPVYTFLEAYDFGGKTIIPFITHGGSGASRTIDTISKLQPGASVEKDALILSRSDVAKSEDAVIWWAEGLGI
ncbi:MAG: flavodoxin [Eubacteriales bacterium]